MKTRSQTILEKKELEFIFDFDEASAAWRSNKKSIGNGSYKYICEEICKNGKKCGQTCVQHDELFICKRHLLYKK
uniref:Uncharacterized protein n=1 Tax=viral metagenome TaxID=1070528 RepID=A0A6C0BA10_9ZZZZ